MKASIYLVNKTVKRWTSIVEEVLGMRLEPHLLIGVGTVLIFLVQITIYFALSSASAYSQLTNVKLLRTCRVESSYDDLPMIYIVTPTYSRYVQKAELTRLSHTFMLAPKVHWIIVEDSNSQTDLVRKFVYRLKNQFNFHTITMLHEPTPNQYKLKPEDPSWKYPRGVWQRNKALRWLRMNYPYLDQDGVVFFADDDNTYDVELFQEMRWTKRVSVWPVAFAGGLLVERPVVNRENKVESFNSVWGKNRTFQIDMAGFAISLRVLKSHEDSFFSATQPIGYIESHFLGQFVNELGELEPKADKCTRLLVWHTQTRNPTLHKDKKLVETSMNGFDL